MILKESCQSKSFRKLYNVIMVERRVGFIKKQVDEIIDGLIFIREIREPFFGIQTVFAPLIDDLIKRRADQKREERQLVEKDEPVAFYRVRTLGFESDQPDTPIDSK